MDTGSLADWVNAAGTLLTFGGAVFAGVVAYRGLRAQHSSLQIEIDRIAADEAARRGADRQAQAVTVAAWVFRSTTDWRIDIVNGSALPVYRLAVRVFGSGVDQVLDRGTQGPTEPRRSDGLTTALRSALVAASPPSPIENLRLELVFTDAAGVRWHRMADGDLQEVPDDFLLAPASA